jgi:metal-responsive CopG/Arc/MetJ family transcriptional regulator
MRKKIEIKVYLPYMMVGELESRRKANARSKFIEDAIREKLDRVEEFDKSMLTDRQVFNLMYLRLRERDDAAALMIKQFLQEELS